jgi:hypothetical protein
MEGLRASLSFVNPKCEAPSVGHAIIPTHANRRQGLAFCVGDDDLP